jgi:hypothetical protein
MKRAVDLLVYALLIILLVGAIAWAVDWTAAQL